MSISVSMILTLQIQLMPDVGTARKLRETIERFNEAANWLAPKAYERKLANGIALHKLYYVENIRQKMHKLKKSLQQKASDLVKQGKKPKNVRRKLSAISGRESRFRRNTNHIISKRIVEKAKDTGKAIALEDLEGIRKSQKRFRKPQRAKMSGWSFFQLRSFIEYKAKRAGIRIEPVDPKYTSQTCAECGHCEKDNRKNQASFLCKQCGHKDHADRNAARNIRARALCQQA